MSRLDRLRKLLPEDASRRKKYIATGLFTAGVTFGYLVAPEVAHAAEHLYRELFVPACFP